MITGLLLTGCVPEPGEADIDPTPSASSSPSTPASAAPVQAAVVVPDSCGALLSDEEVSALTGQDQYLAPDSPSLVSLPGPLARETAEGAIDRLDCLWWIVNVWEATLPLFISRTSAEAQTALIDGLRTSTLYTETTIDGELAFTSTFTDELFINQVVYIFVEDVWIALVAPIEPEVAIAVAEAALAAVSA